jgi:hypothetical protein
MLKGMNKANKLLLVNSSIEESPQLLKEKELNASFRSGMVKLVPKKKMINTREFNQIL